MTTTPTTGCRVTFDLLSLQGSTDDNPATKKNFTYENSYVEEKYQMPCQLAVDFLRMLDHKAVSFRVGGGYKPSANSIPTYTYSPDEQPKHYVRQYTISEDGVEYEFCKLERVINENKWIYRGETVDKTAAKIQLFMNCKSCMPTTNKPDSGKAT